MTNPSIDPLFDQTEWEQLLKGTDWEVMPPRFNDDSLIFAAQAS